MTTVKRSRTVQRSGSLVSGLLLACVSMACSVAEEPAAKKEAQPQKTNRLANETSPYLLQHAHNPVDWYPWGEEALQRAKQENKLIFLSVGYSSCHWCHVMERESFMDDEIAAFLNEHFVCIKVDREERPDIDAIYMRGLEVFYEAAGIQQGGGWPLTMFLTPEAEPFFGGTYFPARDGDRGQATGLFTILQRVHEFWGNKQEIIRRDAKTITEHLKRRIERPLLPLGQKADQKLLEQIQDTLGKQFDEVHGGFTADATNPRQPKFPEPANLLFLLERIRDKSLSGSPQQQSANTMLTVTLDRMQQGGIYDHLGGGFHRYSVDPTWAIPHFEKMLYDNGQLIALYAEGYGLTKRDEYRRVVEETIAFAQRELLDESGGFYSALDADSEGEEGKFYRWTQDELLEVVGKDQWQPFASIYQLDGEPNFEERYYVPQIDKSRAEVAARRTADGPSLIEQTAPLRQKLFERRSQRVRPATDTKILTSWNGLMIRGLADAGRILQKPEYTQLAVRCADFLLANLRTEDGRLRCTYSQGEARLNGYLNDYAYVIDGLLALQRATGDQRWVDEAQKLMDKQIELFWDETGDGFYFTSNDHEALLARSKDFFDTATPAGNSVSATNLLALAELCERDDYREKAELTIQAALPYLERVPSGAPWMAIAISRNPATSP